MHPQQLQLAVTLAVVLLFAGSSMVALAETWALTAGQAACPDLPYCSSSYDVCLAYAAGSYFTGADSPPFTNATSPQRQLAAAPFRFDGEGSFEVPAQPFVMTNPTPPPPMVGGEAHHTISIILSVYFTASHPKM
jgi:hypothetical protein